MWSRRLRGCSPSPLWMGSWKKATTWASTAILRSRSFAGVLLQEGNITWYSEMDLLVKVCVCVCMCACAYKVCIQVPWETTCAPPD